MKKRSPPHFLADEHFNPPAAEQSATNIGGLGGVFKPLLAFCERDLNAAK
jgi:hypothetical protein